MCKMLNNVWNRKCETNHSHRYVVKAYNKVTKRPKYMEHMHYTENAIDFGAINKPVNLPQDQFSVKPTQDRCLLSTYFCHPVHHMNWVIWKLPSSLNKWGGEVEISQIWATPHAQVSMYVVVHLHMLLCVQGHVYENFLAMEILLGQWITMVSTCGWIE